MGISQIVTWISYCAFLGVALKFSYKFTSNYYDKVLDQDSRGQHAEKPIPGTASAVNTPYGLYLDGAVVKLPPNSYVNERSALLNSYTTFTHSVFVRYLHGAVGNVPREILTLSSTLRTVFQLRQRLATENENQLVFELEAVYGSSSAVFTSAVYSLSKV